MYFLRSTSGGSALIDKWYSIRKEKQAQGYHDQVGGRGGEAICKEKQAQGYHDQVTSGGSGTRRRAWVEGGTWGGCVHYSVSDCERGRHQ